MKVNLHFITGVVLRLGIVVMTCNNTKTPIKGKDTSFKSVETTV